MLDSVPMVAITGNVPCDLIGRDSFQEIDITGITLPITKHNYFVQSADDLADVIREAFKIAKSGRPGPVLIDIPKDVQINLGEYEKQSVVEPFPNKIASQADIDRAAEVLKNSSRPYIYIGGGVAGAGMAKDICALADKIDAFIGCSFMGLSAVPTENRRFLGMQGMHGHYASSMAQDEADVILAVGVRFSDRATGKKSRYAKNAKIIHLDLDFSEINKNIPVEVGVCGDIVDSFKRLADAVRAAVHPPWGCACDSCFVPKKTRAISKRTSSRPNARSTLSTPKPRPKQSLPPTSGSTRCGRRSTAISVRRAKWYPAADSARWASA